MGTEIINVQNVHGYVDSNGTVWLNAADVAVGLGFVDTERIKNVTAKCGGKTKIYHQPQSIRWKRVNKYLSEFGYDIVVNKDSFIPENMLYRLAMKANNETAQKFQAKLADEILPSIRKHGVYATDNFIEKSIADPDWAIKVLTELKKTREERDKLKNTVKVQKTQIAELKPKSDYCDVVLQCQDLVPISVIAKDYGYSAMAFNRLLNDYDVQYKQGDIWLPYQKYASLGWTQTKTYVYNEDNNHCNVHTYWTQKGRLGLYQFLKENDILPLIER